MQNYTHELQRFQKLNALAPSGGVVFFGSTFFSQIPVCELAKDCGLEKPVYNRSLCGLTLEQAQQLFPDLTEDLKPDALFICLGETDVESTNFDQAAFIEKYEWLLYTIHRTSRAKLHIVSIVTDSPAADIANRRLKKLAKSTGCTFVDISDAKLKPDPELYAFRLLRPYVRGRIGFAEAMSSTCSA